MMDAQGVRSALDMVGASYNRLFDENKRLKQELHELKHAMQTQIQRKYVEMSRSQRSGSSDLGLESFAQVSIQKLDQCVRSSPQETVKDPLVSLRTDERRLIDEQRNNDLANLHRLIADFDPEEFGEWATREITVQSCEKLLRADSKLGFEPDEQTLEHIVRIFTDNCARDNRPPTSLQLVNISGIGPLETTFGIQNAGLVMQIQDATIRALSNELIDFAGTQADRASVEIHSAWSMLHPRRVQAVLFSASRLELVEGIGTALVVLNTLYLGVSVDIGTDWRGWDIISAVFSALFLIELNARIALVGGFRKFFSGAHRYWNLFDAAIVLISLLDFLTLAVANEEHINIRTLMMVRLTRLIRLTRVARLARTGLFTELAYMIRGIEAGTSTLVWALLLLVFVCYIGAVLLTQTIGRDQSSDFFVPYSKAHFGSISISMFTLFQCFTGDCTTFDGRPLSYILFEQYGRFTIAIYWVCIIAVTFGLFNVIIANFLQNAQRAAKFNDYERRRILKRERRMVQKKTALLLNRIQQVMALRNNADKPISVAEIKISRDDWRNLLKDEEISHWLEDMGCDDGVRRKLFDKIDHDGNGELECDELVSGIVDLLRGRFDDIEQVMVIVKDIRYRMTQLEGSFASWQHLKYSDELFASARIAL